jgi:hypothetical protein
MLLQTYDKSFEEYEDLAAVSRRIFSQANYREKQYKAIEATVGRPLAATEKTFVHRMSVLVEECGGQIEEGLFVTKPGVLLLAEPHVDEPSLASNALLPDSLITFLISGVALETSLEMIAHKEARVARLTSSKTASMNLPLFRIQAAGSTWQQKQVSSHKSIRSNDPFWLHVTRNVCAVHLRDAQDADRVRGCARPSHQPGAEGGGGGAPQHHHGWEQDHGALLHHGAQGLPRLLPRPHGPRGQ